jgi:hypothetical protein
VQRKRQQQQQEQRDLSRVTAASIGTVAGHGKEGEEKDEIMRS